MKALGEPHVAFFLIFFFLFFFTSSRLLPQPNSSFAFLLDDFSTHLFHLPSTPIFLFHPLQSRSYCPRESVLPADPRHCGTNSDSALGLNHQGRLFDIIPEGHFQSEVQPDPLLHLSITAS